MKKLWLLIIALSLASMSVKAQDVPSKLPAVDLVFNERVHLMEAPPHAYEQWWAELKECTHLPVPEKITSKVKWLVVYDSMFFLFGKGPFIGYALAERNSIIIIGLGVIDEKLVKHEMLHYLLWHSANLHHGNDNVLFGTCNTLS